MPSRTTEAALRDIHDHITLAMQFVGGTDFDRFRTDLRTVYAVIRCLEIISEASRRLPDDLKARHRDLPWRQIAGAGNVYRHDYEDITARLVWDTVQRALPALGVAVATEMARLG